MRFSIFFSQLAVCFSCYVQTKLLQKATSQVISVHNINTTETCAKNVTDTHSPLHVCNIRISQAPEQKKSLQATMGGRQSRSKLPVEDMEFLVHNTRWGLVEVVEAMELVVDS